MKKLNQLGFTAIEALVIIVVLTVLGATGLFVAHRMKTSSNLSTSGKTVQSTTPATSGKQSSVVTVKEWGIKITFAADLGTVSYVYDQTTDSILMMSDLQKTLPSECAFGGESPWSYSRQTVAQENSDAYNHPATDKHIGDYYFHRSYPQEGCEQAATTMGKLDAGYNNAFLTIEAE